MKILIIVIFFLFLRMIFKNFFIKKNNANQSTETENDQIIDVEYEELE